MLRTISVVLGFSFGLPHSDAQRYELIPAEQARSLIVGEWESHPSDIASFPEDGFHCGGNSIKFERSGNDLLITTNRRQQSTAVNIHGPSSVKMDLSAIFGVPGSYEVMLANSALAFLTLPATPPEVIDETLFEGDDEPEVTTRQRVVRITRCGDPDRIS